MSDEVNRLAHSSSALFPHVMSWFGSLDSETNLKAKQALSVTRQLGGDVDALAAFSGETSPASVPLVSHFILFLLS